MFRSFEKGQSAARWLPRTSAGLLLRALFKRPRGGTGAATPQLASEFLTEVPGRAAVERYNAALGFAPGSTPVTWYYLIVQRAHLATMLAPGFPHRLLGMVHVENALVQHAMPTQGPILLSTRIEVLPPTASGAVYCALETEGRCGDLSVFTCTSKYLAVRGQRRTGAAPHPAAEPGAAIGSWRLAPSAGWAYARVSGDFNPIHLAGWTALLMGLRAPIIHGMHSLAKACARLEQVSGQRVSAISVRFLAPVPLGGTVVLAHGAQPHTWALYCAGLLAADGSFRLGPEAP